jgi:hypothetical protein
MKLSVNLTIPKYLPILFLVNLSITFITLLSVFGKVSKNLKSIILGMFIPLIIVSIVLIIKPNIVCLISAISLTSISLLSIGLWKGLYTEEDILTGVRKMFIVYGLILPISCLLFYTTIFYLQNPELTYVLVNSDTPSSVSSNSSSSTPSSINSYASIYPTLPTQPPPSNQSNQANQPPPSNQPTPSNQPPPSNQSNQATAEDQINMAILNQQKK